MNVKDKTVINSILNLCRKEYVFERIECADFEFWRGSFYGMVDSVTLASYAWLGNTSFSLYVLQCDSYTFVYVYGSPCVKRGKAREGVLNEVPGGAIDIRAIRQWRWPVDAEWYLKGVLGYNSSANLIGVFDAEFKCVDCLTGLPVDPVVWCPGLIKFLDIKPRQLDKRTGRADQKGYRPDLRERVWAGATVDAALVRDFWEGRGEFTEVMAERVRQACKLADWPCTL
jgi:hypothetical protein